MKRAHWILLCGAFLACSESPDPAGPEETANAATGALDYSKWPCLTPARFVSPTTTLCNVDQNIVPAGPHTGPAARTKYYANTIAAAVLRGAIVPMPVKSVIVKEKWENPNDARPSAYAAMIKRAPGYDPENGDWEYSYVNLKDGKHYENDKLDNCRRCHQQRKTQDYLYLTYLPR